MTDRPTSGQPTRVGETLRSRRMRKQRLARVAYCCLLSGWLLGLSIGTARECAAISQAIGMGAGSVLGLILAAAGGYFRR